MTLKSCKAPTPDIAGEEQERISRRKGEEKRVEGRMGEFRKKSTSIPPLLINPEWRQGLIRGRKKGTKGDKGTG